MTWHLFYCRMPFLPPTLSSEGNKNNFFYNLHYLTEDNRFLLNRKPASDLPHFKNFQLFGVQNDATTNDLLHNLFFVLSQKELIAETRFNVP